MDSLLPSLKRTIFFSIFSLILLVIIPRDPENARFLGYSALRLLMLAFFMALTTLLLAAYFFLRKNPAHQQAIQQILTEYAEKRWLREPFLFVTSSITLIGLLLLVNYFFSTNVQLKGYILRLAPLLFFLTACALQAMESRFLIAYSRKWLLGISFALLYTAAGLFVSKFFLGQLTRPYVITPRMRDASQAGAIWISLLLFTQLAAAPPKERRLWLLVLLIAAAIFTIQWYTYPRSYWRSAHFLALFAPLGITAAVLLTKAAYDLLHWEAARKWKGWSQLPKVVILVVLAALAWVYYIEASRHGREINIHSFTDQDDYIQFAKTARLLNFNYTGDQNRMPLYPFLQGMFYRPGMTDGEFFAQGKQVNLILSLVLLAALYWIFRRFLAMFYAFNLILVIGFTLYIFKAAYIQAEILYYFISFVAFLWMVEMFVRPGLLLAAGTGIALGLAYLTKGSILLGVIIFISIFALRLVLNYLHSRREVQRDREQGGKALANLAALAVVLLCFTAVIFPYIHAMKVRFGHYFYNINTSFYIWYDSLDEAMAADKIYQFSQHWPSQLAQDQIPGPMKFLREHSFRQILDRFTQGVQEQWTNIESQFSVTNYQLSYALIFLVAILLDIRTALGLVKKNPYAILFAVLFFTGYLAAFAWYSPISPERRFTYGLYIPFMFSLFVGIKELAQQQGIRNGGQEAPVDTANFALATNLLITGTLLINIWLVVNERLFFDHYGA